MDTERNTALQPENPPIEHSETYSQQTGMETQAHGRKCEHRKIHKWMRVHGHTQTHIHMITNTQTHLGSGSHAAHASPCMSTHWSRCRNTQVHAHGSAIGT